MYKPQYTESPAYISGGKGHKRSLGKLLWKLKQKFLNKKKILIAEGIFDVLTDTIKGQGGCHYLYKYSKIDTKKWKFYNAKQEQITPTLSLIHHLENLKRIK